MAVSQRLEVRQAQSLVMTPQLQQAIKLLQLSNLELLDYVDQELERNPLLEREEAEPLGEPERETGSRESEEAGVNGEALGGEALGEPESALDFSASEALPDESDSPLDTDYDNIYDVSPSDSWASAGTSAAAPGTAGGGGIDEEGQGFEQRLSENITLRAHLLNQLQLEVSDPVDRMIGVHLIDMLDEAGYLTGEIDALSGLLGCDTIFGGEFWISISGPTASGLASSPSLATTLTCTVSPRRSLSVAKRSPRTRLRRPLTFQVYSKERTS